MALIGDILAFLKFILLLRLGTTRHNAILGRLKEWMGSTKDLSLRKWWYNRNITWECHRHMIGIYYRMDFTQQGVLENLRYVLGKRFDLNVNQDWLSLILRGAPPVMFVGL